MTHELNPHEIQFNKVSSQCGSINTRMLHCLSLYIDDTFHTTAILIPNIHYHQIAQVQLHTVLCTVFAVVQKRSASFVREKRYFIAYCSSIKSY